MHNCRHVYSLLYHGACLYSNNCKNVLTTDYCTVTLGPASERRHKPYYQSAPAPDTTTKSLMSAAT